MAPFGIGAKTLGEIAVPGSAELELPAGKVKLRYVEDREGRSTSSDASNNWDGPDRSLEVTVVADGREVELKKGRGISEGAGFKTIHKEIGSIRLDGPARCTVRAAVESAGGAHPNPRIVLRG